MKAAAMAFLGAMHAHQTPFWLSFLGTSGAGKTFLSELILRACKRVKGMTEHPELINPVLKCYWPRLLTNLRNQEFWRIADLCDANFLLIDEIAAEHDPMGFARDKLCELLSGRVGKWTVITSNLSLTKLGEIDTRIASRMVRSDSVVVKVTAIDYAKRRKVM